MSTDKETEQTRRGWSASALGKGLRRRTCRDGAQHQLNPSSELRQGEKIMSGFCFAGDGCAACREQDVQLQSTGSTDWLLQCQPDAQEYQAVIENGSGYHRYFRQREDAERFTSGSDQLLLYREP